MTLNEHAEAILRALGLEGSCFAHLAGLDQETRDTFLAAVAALHTEAFGAGALAMRQQAEALEPLGRRWIARAAIRAIDPVSLRKDV